ncbi:Uncharacterized protein dnm_039260 [Desulfonema magnum]|uniref:Uncharacterized protein n=1 Tax=Desulfonema magnum TaxID=45655 RepID=A0A975BLV8_9BACT|nr:Uncharacterized protein dnm_039260 [Desulfonema magnum]
MPLFAIIFCPSLFPPLRQAQGTHVSRALSLSEGRSGQAGKRIRKIN